jgi:hypothetical protein
MLKSEAIFFYLFKDLMIILVFGISLNSCQKNHNRSLSISIQKEASLNSMSFDFIEGQNKLFTSQPTQVSELECVGILMGYSQALDSNQGSCTLKSGALFNVASAHGLVEFSSGTESAIEIDNILRDQLLDIYAVAFKKNTSTQVCPLVNSEFSPDSLSFSEPYIVASANSINSSTSGPVNFTATLDTNNYIESCDTSIFDKDNSNTSSNNFLTNLTAYYPMEQIDTGAQGGGSHYISNIADTNSNNLNANSTGTQVTGILGNAIHYAQSGDGANQVSGALGDYDGSTAISISFWLKGTLLEVQNTNIFKKYTGTAGSLEGYMFGFSSVGNAVFNVFNQTQSEGPSWTQFNANCDYSVASVWKHYVLIIDNDGAGKFKINMYGNGQSCGVYDSRSIFDISTLGSFYIGYAQSDIGGNAVNSYNGSIDELAVWNRALTAAEVQSLYNGGSALAFANFQ